MANERSSCFVYVGCRTTKERNARGEGIGVFRMDAHRWSPVQLVGDLVNPSFLIFEPRRKCLYVVHGDQSEVSAFRIEPADGSLTLLNRQSTKGRNPVHLAVDPTNRFLVLANYATGAVVTLPIDEDGALGEVRDLVALPGAPGPHRIEQNSSHPHEVVFDVDRRFIAVPDKGLDRIFIFTLDTASGRLLANDPPWIATREGAGPRHICFHPNRQYAYVVNEMNSTLAAYSWEATRGQLTPRQILPSIPPDFVGNNRAAEIAISPSGRHVYVSNRGHDSIGCFSVSAASGLLAPVQWAATGGQGPRFFTFDPAGRRLYAANELTDTIVAFAAEGRTGKLSPADIVVETGSPVCICLAALR
jgi:6-phosphogluconolactonase (cycloisomerase 2 family)